MAAALVPPAYPNDVYQHQKVKSGPAKQDFFADDGFLWTWRQVCNVTSFTPRATPATISPRSDDPKTTTRDSITSNPSCFGALISADAQRSVAVSYVAAFLSGLGGDATALAYLREPLAVLRPASLSPALSLHGQSRSPTAVLLPVDDFEAAGQTPDISSSGRPVTATVASLSLALLQDSAVMDETEPWNRFFQETKGALFTWSSPSVYVHAHNRGLHLSPPAAVRVYWGDPLSALAFPADWHTGGFFTPNGQATNTLAVPSVPGRNATLDGVVVVGPLLFKPPFLKGPLNPNANVDLFARVVALDDPTRPATPSLAEVQQSNNVAMRIVQIGCTPQCKGRACGNDQCGGTCGSCGAPQSCSEAGLCICGPRCDGRQCGTDGCGGQCGACQADLVCKAGQCTADPCAACAEGETCVRDRCVPQGCGAGCGAGSQCGDDDKCHRCPGSVCP